MNTTVLDKLKDVPPHVVNKFLREVTKAKDEMNKAILWKVANKNEDEAKYIVDLEAQKLVKRYKQLIRLHLKKYKINVL